MQRMQRTNGRQQILHAALMTFARKGYDGASIRDIAQQAELSLSALYYYFPSKQDALFALISQAYTTYNETASRVLRQAGSDVAAQVAYWVQHLVSYRCTNIMYSRVILLEAGRLDGERYTEVRHLQNEARALFENVVAQGMRDGLFDVDDPVLTTRTINAICNAIPQWYRPGGSYTEEKLAREYVLTAFRILGSDHAHNVEPFFTGKIDTTATRLDPVPTA